MMWKRDEPTSFGPSPLRKVPLVEISTRSRRPAIARPRISSDCPCEYTSALSNMVTPASRQMSTIRVASLTSFAPHGLKKSVWPPNVPVPKVRTGTFNPELPSCRYSMCVYPSCVHDDVPTICCLRPPSAGCGLRPHSRRDDETTRRRSQRIAPSALFTKHTKLTKAHKEGHSESLRRIATAD